MNKNKIIFAILGAIVFGLLVILILNLSSSSSNTTTTQSAGDFSIWVLEDDPTVFQEYLNIFKETYPQYRNKSFVIESFGDQKTYNNTLTSAVLNNSGPDMFLLNNSESSPLENQILAINPGYVSPNDFRLRFKPVFSNDLIITDGGDETLEFLKGIPLGYESLGVFYNRKYFLRPSELQTWTDFAAEIKEISEKYSNIIPLAIGNGSAVTHAPEIIKSFFVAEGANALNTTSLNESRQVLGMYSEFGSENGDNAYNKLFTSLYSKSDIDVFVEGNVAAMIGYPRDLFSIDEMGYQRSFLFTTPFPRFTGSDHIVSVNYNYFVVNKDSQNTALALDLLQFMASEQGQSAYIDTYPYYLSPELAVEEELLEKKIHPNYNIVYKNFVDEDMLLVSYNVGNKSIFDTELNHILNMRAGQEEKFTELSSFLTCSTTKQTSLLNLSSPCK